MIILDIPLEEFLRPFFDPAEDVHIRVFDDRKTGTFKGAKLCCEAGKIGTLTDTLRKHNAQNRGIFFVVNYGGDSDAEITRINAVFVENDSLSIDEQIRQLEEFSLPPSLMVKTAKSVHAYWLVKDAPVSDFRRLQKKLIAQFNGDASCVNESRVLRLPGFNHCKNEPVMVECVKFSPELRYTMAELETVLPQIAEEPDNVNNSALPVEKGNRRGLALVGKRCDFIQYCKDNAAALPENLWYAMISNLAVFEDGDKEIHALSKPYPNYNYNEAQSKISHFLESGTKPMTCAKISEYSYKCPKFDNGGCDCKSPAALCYKPMTADEILIILNSFDIPASAIEKIKIIKNFIQDYLYNIEPVIAETIINYNIKTQFNFKANDILPLIKLHREVYKKYADSKEMKRETEFDELPEWYEVTGKGGVKFIAGLLADHMANNVFAIYTAGSHYFYEHGVYVQKDDIEAWAAVRSFMISRYTKSNDITDAANQWRMLTQRNVREINANPYIINLKNGLYDLNSNEFRPHDSNYLSTVQLQANYNPSAKCPQFLDFLSGILPESEIPLIQEMFGYLLIPVNKAQKSFVLVGAANAGKSTLLSIAQTVLLGIENVSNIPWQSLNDRFKTAELFGKLANIFADLPSKNIEDAGFFKTITGEDYIIAERKNKDPFSFQPYARLLFSCNEIPKNYADRSDGFYRRLIIIRFDKSVPAEKRDPSLKNRVSCERDGIFTWALDGLRRLTANNYRFSETARTGEELRRYKVESNSALMFLEECCEIGNGTVVREELFERYCDYCRRNGLKSSSQTKFNKEVEQADSRIEKDRDGVARRAVWKGLRLSDTERHDFDELPTD
ncbi:MAG: phage/plasmid primase, P4 family [Oscillospiraceae bacterium]|nr:phage/plasmid primase, P4 family [Oscillospiraceae bacterium]